MFKATAAVIFTLLAEFGPCLAAQQPQTATYRVPSAQFATRVGCDSAKIALRHHELFDTMSAAPDSSKIGLVTACDALAWLGAPSSYEFSTFNGEPSQQVWHYAEDTLLAPML